jgi:hypothetical protein
MFDKLSKIIPSVVAIILLVLVVNKDYLAPMREPAEQHDAKIVQLGKDYKIKIGEVAANPFKAVADGSFDTIQELTDAQQKATTQALTEAYLPISKELESRFGKAEENKAAVSSVKSFFADLSYGYGTK